MAKYQAKYAKQAKTKKKGWILIVLLIIIGALAAAGRFLPQQAAEYFLPQQAADEVQTALRAEVTIEAGDKVPSAEAFLVEDTDTGISYVSDVSQIDTCVPGVYNVTLSVDGDTRQAAVRVEDTTAPMGTVQNLTVRQAEMPAAEDFVTGVQDVTDVSIRYEEEPDKDQTGEQTVTILLTDTSGNVTSLQAVLTVLIDQEAPVIEGVQDITVYQGDAIAYRSGITVTDNEDEAPQLDIDSSSVDLSTPGVYEVTYSATDASGNRSEAIAVITVLEKKDSYVELDVIYEKADKIISSIITEDMTAEDQVKAIYSYIRKNYGYINSSDKDDWRQAAYKMMQIRCGDCFSYFSLCKLLLERLEIPNIDVAKVPNYSGDSHHYWSLVSVDGGETYYHVDVTPRSNDPTTFLLVTDAFLDAYSAKHYNCFNRDTSLYPATPEE